jgi:hypothetical protein
MVYQVPPGLLAEKEYRCAASAFGARGAPMTRQRTTTLQANKTDSFFKISSFAIFEMLGITSERKNLLSGSPILKAAADVNPKDRPARPAPPFAPEAATPGRDYPQEQPS